MDETVSQKDAALSLSDGGPLRQVRDPGGLESEGLTLRGGSILRGRTPHTSQMSDSQALTEFGMVTVQGQTGLGPSESEIVILYSVSAAAADLSHVLNLGHDVFGGHMAVKRTKERIEFTFYWPTLHDDCREYVRRCHVCQVKKRKTPITPIQRSDRLFEHFFADCAAPLSFW